jgi:hypothetical protein
MKNKILPIVLIAAIGLAGIACTIPISLASKQPDQNQVALQVAQTVAAINALKAQQQAAQATLPPAPTIAPPPTQAPLPTSIPVYSTPAPTPTVYECMHAVATDASYPDYTDVTHSTSFNKTWTFSNVGYCTWNTGYHLTFVSGSQMGGASPRYLVNSVAPGGSINITVTMTAPASVGTYTGNWQFYSDTGVAIGTPVWVTIDVV